MSSPACGGSVGEADEGGIQRPAPSTTLRVVPLPRFAGEDISAYRSPAQKRWMRAQASSSRLVAVA